MVRGVASRLVSKVVTAVRSSQAWQQQQVRHLNIHEYQVYLCQKLALSNEMYFAITLDRASAGPVIIACRKGGTSIEDLAEKYPDMIIKAVFRQCNKTGGEVKDFIVKSATLLVDTDIYVPVDIYKGITDEDAAKVVDGLSPKLADRNASIDQVKKLYKLFCDTDCTLLEVAAAEADLNYIGLDGEIGCMVNGAGLAMSTMDIIKLHGGTPANFLDVGGNASEGQVALKVPVVVRLEGTNVDLGKGILKESGMALITAEDLDDAAEKAVKAAVK